jgi:hypothetical protein
MYFRISECGLRIRLRMGVRLIPNPIRIPQSAFRNVQRQYTQLLVSAPAGAVLIIHCAIAGMYR